MYLRRGLIDELGEFDADFPMAFEDVDYCLRAWEAGWRVRYAPDARLTHVESTTRGTAVGERELRSQQHFWAKWGDWFDRRDVQAADGSLRIIYVTQDTGVGGGHRDVFEHLNRLRARGHEVELFCLSGPPDWFPLEAPVKTFETYDDLTAALAKVDAMKVATWWETARPVWRASVTPRHPRLLRAGHRDLLLPGRPGGAEPRARQLSPGVPLHHDLRLEPSSGWPSWASCPTRSPGDRPGQLPSPRPRQARRRGARDRPQLPLKNLPLTIDAWKRLEPRPELWMFGVEPELGPEHGARYFERPSDERVNELFNEATVFVQTSIHEGFCLPLLEAMAAGTPIVCTDAHGNRDFCRHEQNCLIADADPDSVSAALARVLVDVELRARLVDAGLDTAADYAWERRIDQLERFFLKVAQGLPLHETARPAN